MLPEFFTIEDSDPKLESWLDRLFGPEVFREYSYKRLEKHFGPYKLFFEELELPLIIVGGTNGKGEVSLFLEKLCLQNDRDLFLWTSPHIISVRERFSKSGRAISARDLYSLFEQLEQDSQELSYYEFLFKCFCEFVKSSIGPGTRPIIILEVGLGGRLDATNFFDSGLSILTSISLDHTAILGNSLSAILTEKIEITRTQTALFSGVSQGFLKEKILAYCAKKNVDYHDVDSEFQGQEDFHERNLALAKSAFSYLARQIGIDRVNLSIEGSVWGRPLRVTYKECQFILLGSHNLDGLRHLARWAFKVQSQSSDESFFFNEGLFGFSRQDEDELVKCLKIIERSSCLGIKRRVVAFSHQRATPIMLLERAFTQLGDSEVTGLLLENDFQDSIDNFEEGQTILVSGSYYFITSFIHTLSKRSVLKFT